MQQATSKRHIPDNTIDAALLVSGCCFYIQRRQTLGLRQSYQYCKASAWATSCCQPLYLECLLIVQGMMGTPPGPQGMMGTLPGPQGMMATSLGAQQGPLSPPRGHLGSMPQGMLPLSGPPMHYMGYSPYFPAQSAGECPPILVQILCTASLMAPALLRLY